MSEELSDSELIAAFNGGDSEALGLLMERHKAAESRLDLSAADLVWNSRVDSGLDSVEYSMYQAQSDMASVSSDWEYKYSALEDEGLWAGMQDEV